MTDWAYISTLGGVLLALYVLIVKILPFGACLVASYFLKTVKLEFCVDLWRCRLRSLRFTSRKIDVRISHLRLVPCIRLKKISFRLELSKVVLILQESTESSSSKNSELSSLNSVVEWLKKVSKILSVSCDSLKISAGSSQSDRSLNVDKSALFFDDDSQTLSIRSDSLRYVWAGDENWVDLEMTVDLILDEIPHLEICLLRTRLNLKGGVLFPSQSSPRGGKTSLPSSALPFTFNVKAELVSIEIVDLGVRATLGLCQVRKEDPTSLSVTCLNFCSTHAGEDNLISFDAINFHTSAEKTHIASVTKVDVHNFKRLVLIGQNLLAMKGPSNGNEEESSENQSSRKVEVMIVEVTISLEEDLKVLLPALTWKMDDDVVGHCVNFDKFSMVWNNKEFLTVQDVLILFHEKKLSIAVSSSMLSSSREALLGFISKKRTSLPPPPSSLNVKTTKSSPFCKEIAFELADFKIRFELLPNASFILNASNLIYSKRFLECDEPEEFFELISLQLFIKKIAKTDRFIYVQKFNFSKVCNRTLCELSGESSFLWKPDVHLALTRFYGIIREALCENRRPSIKSCPKKSREKIVLKISRAFVIVQMQKHELSLSSQNCIFELQPKDISYKCAFPSIVIDTGSNFKKVAALSGLVIKFTGVPVEKNYRKDIEGVINSSNRSLEIFVTNFELNMLHNLILHEMFFEEFLGIYKWIKKLHGLGSNTPNGSLPPDVIFYVKQIQVDFHDDPFEVRLKKNYELMEDEHYEAEKRKSVLESKIDEIRNSDLLLPVTKEEKLFADLRKKDADIYIQRAQNYHAKSTKKAKLLSWSINSLQFMILADPSMNSKEAIQSFIQTIDQESPWHENLEFVTQMLRWIRFECKLSTIYLRDFPQPLADLRHVLMWGKVALADEAPLERALKKFILYIDEPFEDAEIGRSMVATKIYHDVALDMVTFATAHGPCWEPILSHFSLLLNNVFSTSLDPSPPLPWWDKVRYIFHGRFLIFCKSFKAMLHTSPDPYNTTEEIELNLFNANFHWCNEGLLKCSGDLDLFIRNETKYDDCQLLHFPGLTLSIKFDWVCLGNPNDHHSVIPCAPDKVPEYSHTFDHDSYRAFRSQNLNTRISVEGKSTHKNRPHIHMYSSTIRWMESIKWLFSGASRPIRRGPFFRKDNPPRKPSILRHLKKVQISLALKQLQVDYWMSASMNKGVLFNLANGLSLSAECSLKLVNVNDGLKHRKRSVWSTAYLNCELSTADIWFQCTKQNSDEERFLEKSFFFSVENVKYSREMGDKLPIPEEDLLQVFPSHSIVVLGARGAWTESNRDMCFSLYESWKRAHILRQQISSEALKGIAIPHSSSSPEDIDEHVISSSSNILSVTKKSNNEGELSLSNIATWKTTTDAVEKLLSDTAEGTNHTPIVYSEDQSSDTKKKDMEAMLACSKNDTYHRRWNIKFLNSQMLLKGIETEGHVILSASKAEIIQNIHIPVWKDQTLLSKKSWSGSLESMQCFATVSPHEDGGSKLKADQISWLTQNIIEEREVPVTLVSELVGSGQSVGGVISKIVGSKDEQLQRIVSRCKCEFFYVDYDDCEGLLKKMPKSTDFHHSTDTVINSFSLIHHDLNICTNSLQYSVVLDVLNNLMLYTEPLAESRSENYLRIKYRLLLSKIEDQWKPITQLQNEVRHLVCLLRQKEKEIYNIQVSTRSDAKLEYEKLELEAATLKDTMTSKSEELEIRLRCLREFNMSSRQRQARNYEDAKQLIRRKSEIFFSRAQWRLTENDGQLGIADASISNFFYTKTLMPDDTTEHSLEMGYIYLKNLLPNQIYEDVLFPTELQKDVPLDKHPTLRVFCREKAPVGGISVKDHFEINLSPLTISITHALYYKIMHFCFPEKPEYEDTVEKKPGRRKGGTKEKVAKSNFYVKSPLKKDDVEMMKDRAQQNKLFVYIKIPEVPICISYKGEKEKNRISDLANFVLRVPNIEYHNVTWTWLDLFLAIKSQSKDSLFSQLIKEKLKLPQRVVGGSGSIGVAVGGGSHDDGQDNDDEKAKLLLGLRQSASKPFVKK